MADTRVSTRDDTADKLAKAELNTGGRVAAIVPQDAEQAYRMAQLILRSGVAPRDMQSADKIVTAIFHGLEVGMKPIQAVQSIAVINGRPTLWGDGALGVVRGSDLVEDFEETFKGEFRVGPECPDDFRAVCRIKRKDNASDIVREFSVADAKAAGLWSKSGPWKTYPKRMLQMRARSWALRDGFADVLKGLGITEEVRDFHSVTAMQDVTPVTADAIAEQATEAEAYKEPVTRDEIEQPDADALITAIVECADVKALNEWKRGASLDALPAKEVKRVEKAYADRYQMLGEGGEETML